MSILSSLKQSLRQSEREPTMELQLDVVQKATLALVAEIALADETVSSGERRLLESLYKRYSTESESKHREQIEKLLVEIELSPDLQRYSRIIRDKCSEEQKQQILELLWQMGYSDGNIDSIEQHIIRKIANLIYASHKSYIVAKNNARRQFSV